MKEGTIANKSDVHRAIEMIDAEIDDDDDNYNNKAPEMGQTIEINDDDGEFMNNRNNRQMIIGNQ